MAATLLHVLHIDDEPAILTLVKASLASVATVDSVDSLAAAQAQLASSITPKYDAILVDLLLPDAKGTEAVTALRPYGIPIIVISAVACPKILMAAAEAGAEDYLVKPNITFTILANRIQFACHRAQKRAAGTPTRRAMTVNAFEALKPYVTYGSKPPFAVA
jgi:DNA-binding response OmpR family regulator